MLLVIDVGNSNIVLGVMDAQTLLYRARIVTDKQKADYTADITQALRSFGDVILDGAVLGSVVPEVNGALCAAVREAAGVDTLVVSPALQSGLTLAIPEPDTLAADIIAGCVGAAERCPLPLAVVDMGTATTVVVVDAQRRYLGGAILPGVKLSLGALVGGTSLLPDLSLYAPAQCICGETVDAMCAGMVYGTASMVDGLVSRMEKELGTSLNVVATGGLSALVVPHCGRRVQYEPDLLLYGLAALYEKNRGDRA